MPPEELDNPNNVFILVVSCDTIGPAQYEVHALLHSLFWARYTHQFICAGLPEFSSHAEHRQHILIHTAAVFRDFSRKGFTEGQSGHISVRDPEFEHYIWMNPLGKHFGLMTAGDLICLDVNTGKVVGGNKVRFSRH